MHYMAGGSIEDDQVNLRLVIEDPADYSNT